MLDLITAICKKVGSRRLRHFENKQNKTNPRLGFALLNGFYSPMLPNYL